MTGEITRSAWTNDTQSDRRAALSPFQNRRRERRMYQFDRSSMKDSNERSTLTVR
jgi:hypothetical protein